MTASAPARAHLGTIVVVETLEVGKVDETAVDRNLTQQRGVLQLERAEISGEIGLSAGEQPPTWEA